MTYVWVARLGVMADHFGWRGGWWGVVGSEMYDTPCGAA